MQSMEPTGIGTRALAAQRGNQATLTRCWCANQRESEMVSPW